MYNFEIVAFTFLDGDVPLSKSFGAYMSQLIPFGVSMLKCCDFNNRNKCLTAKLLKEGS